MNDVLADDDMGSNESPLSLSHASCYALGNAACTRIIRSCKKHACISAGEGRKAMGEKEDGESTREREGKMGRNGV